MDTNKITGRIRLQIYKRFDSPWKRFFNKALAYFPNWQQQFLDTFGVLKEDTGWIENSTMNVAFAVFAGLAGNTGSQTAFGYLAVGTSNTAVSASQTTLVAEISTSGLARAAATVSRVTTTQTNDTLQLLKTWTASGSVTVEEIGYFNASSSGVMGGRALTSTKSLVNGETLTGTYQIKFS